ncbi:DUF3737 family protein, partial [Levilactobacillus namurensis]|uniref:DUF3737 family protein n=1 Tax=Levilactobacillus namurensis TaxID=380393 RepID=UPI00222EA1F2
WRRRHFSAGFWVGGLFALGLTAFHVIFWETEERYALPLLPLLLAGAASSFRLPERCPVRHPRVWSRTLVASFSVLMVGALAWGGVVHTRPVTQLVDAVSQNEGRYYQDHLIRLHAGQHLTQPFTAPVTLNRLVVDPNRGTRGQLTLETRQGKPIWRSAKRVSLANVKLPDQPAGTYQLRVTNSGNQPLAVVTAPANYPLLPHALQQHPHQYLRFVARHAALAPLLTPKRYAQQLRLKNVDFSDAGETLWWCDDVQLDHVTVNGDYFGMNTNNVVAHNLKVTGNYVFDGGKNIEVHDSTFITHDAFWNCENVTIYNSTIIGEYLAWNAKNITFVDCWLESDQGLCYVDHLTMRNCSLINTDLSFEYCTDIDATIKTSIDSVKNPVNGQITAPKIGQIIFDDPAIDPKQTTITIQEDETHGK